MVSARQVKKDPVIFYTKLRFFLTFIFLTLLTFGTFLILINQVEQAEEDALVISVMENQYGFVHKAFFLSSNYAQSNDVQERLSLRESVRDALSMIIAYPSGSAKATSKAESLLPAQTQRKIYEIYCAASSKLNEEVIDYMSSVKNFLLGSPVHLSQENPQLRALQAKTLRLLAVFRTAVKQHQRESREKIEFLKMLGLDLFILTLVCLCLVGLLVFMPTLRKISSYLTQLNSVNQALEIKVKDRTAELEQKATELAISNQQLQEQVQERTRAEDELREANAFLDSVIENIPDMIFIKDAKELRFVRFNKAGEELLGFDRNDLLGKNDYDFFPKEQADFFVKKDRDTLDSKILLEIPEEPINTREKGARILHTKKIPIVDSDGKSVFLLGISEDITERIHSEKRLKDLSMAMENALDGIAQLDPNMKFLSVNKAYAAMMGYAPEELIGLNRLVTICPEDHDKAREAVEKMREHGKAEVEVKVIRKDGTIFHQYVVIVKSMDREQNFEGFYCFAQDITERKYKESLEIKSELIQMVSHELRTPIHSVKEGISIVLEGLTGQLSPEQKEVLEIAKRCADRLGRLVTDVLAFHKLEAGVIEFNMKKSDLNDLIEDVTGSMKPLAKEKGLHFDLKLEKNLRDVEIDHDKIVQVLTNFLQNAIKFTPQGAVTVTSSASSSGVTVSVQDTGIGIQQKDISKLFRKFGQLEAGKSMAPGGTGLGLAISKKIIERHHGKVDVSSELKRGSVFSFTLPFEQPKHR